MATFVALLSHVAGGGQLPAWLGIAVPWMLSLAVSTVLSGRRLSLWRLSISVAVSQALFHTLFVLGTVPAGRHSAPDAAHAGHSTMLPALSAGTQATELMQADLGMWLWHGVAAVVTIAALYRGERALVRLRDLALEAIGWARRRVLAIIPQPLVLPSVRLMPVEAGRLRLPTPLLASLRRRGPPSFRVV